MKGERFGRISAYFGLDLEVVLHFEHFLLVLFELRFQIDILVLEFLDVFHQLSVRAFNRLYLDLQLFDLKPSLPKKDTTSADCLSEQLIEPLTQGAC